MCREKRFIFRKNFFNEKKYRFSNLQHNKCKPGWVIFWPFWGPGSRSDPSSPRTVRESRTFRREPRTFEGVSQCASHTGVALKPLEFVVFNIF